MFVWCKIEVSNEHEKSNQDMMNDFVKLVKILNKESHQLNDTKIKIVYFNHDVNKCEEKPKGV